MTQDHSEPRTRPSETKRLQRRAAKQEGRARRAEMMLDIQAKQEARHEQLENLAARLETRVARLEARLSRLETALAPQHPSPAEAPR